MTLRSALPLSLATLLLSFAPAARGAEPATCTGTLSGDVKGTFRCTAEIVTGEDGKRFFVLTPLDPIEGVPSYKPGSFELPGTLGARTLTLDDLGQGMASVHAEGGAHYSATKTTGQRGEVKLVLVTVEREQGPKLRYTVSGTYRARLLPTSAGRKGAVVIEARF